MEQNTTTEIKKHTLIKISHCKCKHKSSGPNSFHIGKIEEKAEFTIGVSNSLGYFTEHLIKRSDFVTRHEQISTIMPDVDIFYS
jgi:hypothetical protein